MPTKPVVTLTKLSSDRRDWGPIDPGIVEHEWKGNGKRCEVCGWLDGQHYWPWDSRGG